MSITTGTIKSEIPHSAVVSAGSAAPASDGVSGSAGTTGSTGYTGYTGSTGVIGATLSGGVTTGEKMSSSLT